MSIITCTLRFKIDCSYQNGIRDYVYISQPATQHSTAPSNWILWLLFPSFYWFNCEICIFWATIYLCIHKNTTFIQISEMCDKFLFNCHTCIYCNGKMQITYGLWQLISIALQSYTIFLCDSCYLFKNRHNSNNNNNWVTKIIIMKLSYFSLSILLRLSDFGVDFVSYIYFLNICFRLDWNFFIFGCQRGNGVVVFA